MIAATGPGPDMQAVRPTLTPYGTLLRAERIRADLSQVELADRSGVDHSTVSRLESGSRYPSFPMMQRLADALRVSPEIRALMLVEAFIPRSYRADVLDVLLGLETTR